MLTPYKYSGISNFVNFADLLRKHGFTDEGYDKAVEEAVDIADQKITSPTKASRQEMRSEVEDHLMRLVFLSSAPADYVLEEIKTFFLMQRPHDVHNVTKALINRFGVF